MKQRGTEKQEAINAEGKKTLQDPPSYSPLEEKEVSEAPDAEAEKDSDSWVPVATRLVIPERKDSERHVASLCHSLDSRHFGYVSLTQGSVKQQSYSTCGAHGHMTA